MITNKTIQEETEGSLEYSVPHLQEIKAHGSIPAEKTNVFVRCKWQSRHGLSDQFTGDRMLPKLLEAEQFHKFGQRVKPSDTKCPQKQAIKLLEAGISKNLKTSFPKNWLLATSS